MFEKLFGEDPMRNAIGLEKKKPLLQPMTLDQDLATITELQAAANRDLEREREIRMRFYDTAVALEVFARRKGDWADKQFGTGCRTQELIFHLEKELLEVSRNPFDKSEWIDIILLAMDGYRRHGGKAEDLFPDMQAKQQINYERKWVEGPDGVFEHDRSAESIHGKENTDI